MTGTDELIRVALEQFGGKTFHRYVREPLPMYVKREKVWGRGLICGDFGCKPFVFRRSIFYRLCGTRRYRREENLGLILADVPRAVLRSKVVGQ